MLADLLIVLALIVFSLPFVALIGLVWIHLRLRRLEARLDELHAPAWRLADVRPPARRRTEASPATPPAAAAPPIETTPVESPRVEAPPAARPAATAPRAPREAPAPTPAPKGPGMEERLGARLPVWIGSVALALAGVFIVKYTFDRGLLGPTTRVAFGLIFGVSLLAFGEWFRRKDRRIAAGVTAAAIADLYASLLAGTTLYHLIPMPVGFGLLALVTGTAVALSLRQGPIIALVGLVGGFLTPGLIGA
ncbi:MAG: DUF2339 domain-containing protein, partial [Acidobacteriota bacterium]|nr:DUF2339 domain-containing protein [Acidobacteriota bacterium]